MKNQMHRQPVAQAVPWFVVHHDWLFRILHGLLALMIPLLLLFLTGCPSSSTGESINYGPEVSDEAIDDAVIEAIMDADASRIKVGAFVHFASRQILAGGKVNNVVADTGQTIIAKEVEAESINYRIVENKVTYGYEDGPRKVSTEFLLSVATGLIEPAVNESTVLTRAFGAKSKAGQGSFLKTLSLERLLSQLSEQSIHPELRTLTTTRTYHGLKTKTYDGPPPARVREQPNCLGIPECKMTYRQIDFDEVYWTDGKSERVHYEFVISPQAPPTSGYNFGLRYPFVPGLIRACVTLMVRVGEGESRTLLTQCQDVENFRFEAAQ